MQGPFSSNGSEQALLPPAGFGWVRPMRSQLVRSRRRIRKVAVEMPRQSKPGEVIPAVDRLARHANRHE